jgi:tetratricopeptide (TPR) repeat protein
MEGAEEARELLAQRKYKEAGRLLEHLITDNREDDELWYLRGVVSLKLKNYDSAMECFERAILIGRKPKYYQTKGMANFEIFQLDEAIGAFSESLALDPHDATSHFFIALCYMLQDDPRSGVHLKQAHEIDKRKKKQLLMNFYTLFLKNDARLSELQKADMEKRLKGISE